MSLESDIGIDRAMPARPARLIAGRAAGDGAVLLLAGVLAELAVIGTLRPEALVLCGAMVLGTLAVLTLGRVYREPPGTGLQRSLGAWLAVMGAVLGLDALLLGLAAPHVPNPDSATLVWPAAFAALGATGLALRRSSGPRLLDPRETGGQPVYLAGALDDVVPVLRRLRAQPDSGLDVLGLFLDEETDGAGTALGAVYGVPILGHVDALPAAVARTGVDTVVAAPGSEARASALLHCFQAAAVEVLVPVPSGAPGTPARLRRVQGRPMTWRGRTAKAALDYGLGTLLTLMTLPLMGAIALAIKLESRGPVLFRQPRTGLNGQPVTIYKFRTMYHELSDVEAHVSAQREDPRVTRLGAWLRRTSLDELPQFLNVLQGRLSLVGPRPHAPGSRAGGLLFPDAVASYMARHRVKPGVTGFAQVNGWRGSTHTRHQLDQRVAHDLWYIDNWNVWLDLCILVRTPGAMLGKNVY